MLHSRLSTISVGLASYATDIDPPPQVLSCIVSIDDRYVLTRAIRTREGTIPLAINEFYTRWNRQRLKPDPSQTPRAASRPPCAVAFATLKPTSSAATAAGVMPSA